MSGIRCSIFGQVKQVEFNVSNQTGVLYVIGTPIGNLQDISNRAKQTLHDVDLILAEDTRHSKKLLDHLGVSTPMKSYHDFNEHKSIPGLLESLHLGKNLALISDAGTPLISDPGYHLVKAVHEQGIKLIPIPGVSALITAVSVAGIATDRFIFEGFLPEKHVARRKHLEKLAFETRTIVLYEAPHRILDFLEDAKEVLGDDRLVCLCRELTKKFETIYRDTLANTLEILIKNPLQQKGEFVVVIQGADDKSILDVQEITRIIGILLKHGLAVKQTSAIAAEITGARKNDLYKLVLKLNGK